MANIVYLNGELVPRRRASISALDYGFLYGFGLFETMRAYDGKVFRLYGHINRLADAADRLGFSLDKVEILKAVSDTIRANRLVDARVRVTVSAGEGAINANLLSCRQPTLLVVAEGYKPYAKEVYEKGFRAVVSKTRRNSQSVTSGMKSTSYIDSMLIKQEAGDAGADEAVCLDEKGYLAEAAMSNIFIVFNNVLKTPRPESGILPGITRQAVLELACGMGVESLECDLQPEELYRAHEAFLTNSLIEIMPLIEVEGEKIDSGKPGPLTSRFIAAYKEMVTCENINKPT
ncbi:aminotransferase class IV [Chloroflexota bacterium]